MLYLLVFSIFVLADGFEFEPLASAMLELNAMASDTAIPTATLPRDLCLPRMSPDDEYLFIIS